MEKNQNYLVYVTVKDEGEGLSIAQKVVEKRLAACANLYPLIESIFNYQNQIQTQDEAVLILKTTAQAYDKLRASLLKYTLYDDPCILKLPIESGAADFMSWIKAYQLLVNILHWEAWPYLALIWNLGWSKVNHLETQKLS